MLQLTSIDIRLVKIIPELKICVALISLTIVLSAFVAIQSFQAMMCRLKLFRMLDRKN